MDTPICDFVRRYADSGVLRLHMPGHKGLGEAERLDITEVAGADSLYEADGIIAQSEQNASALFGCPTVYSTEGSSQCIRAMLHLATCGQGKKIAAGRNAHKAFLSAVALLDLDVVWLYGRQEESYLSCAVTPEAVAALPEDVTALYITSPDYLGNMADIAALAQACHKRGMLLLVDNAHGAYLRFLQPSLHPMDLGADLCCDSAHKTLPVLTGGAYLHVRDEKLAAQAKNALALFGSTSPSYLILQSLDRANRYISEGYPEKLAAFVSALDGCKARLGLPKGEPMKLTVPAKTWGYTGTELADLLRQNLVECEFSDPDYLVLMPTPETALPVLEEILGNIPRKAPVGSVAPCPAPAEQALPVRRALLAPSREVPVEESLGQILASPSVGCPPAVPILVCGERIDETAIACFRYYGITHCRVVTE